MNTGPRIIIQRPFIQNSDLILRLPFIFVSFFQALQSNSIPLLNHFTQICDLWTDLASDNHLMISFENFGTSVYLQTFQNTFKFMLSKLFWNSIWDQKLEFEFRNQNWYDQVPNNSWAYNNNVYKIILLKHPKNYSFLTFKNTVESA